MRSRAAAGDSDAEIASVANPASNCIDLPVRAPLAKLSVRLMRLVALRLDQDARVSRGHYLARLIPGAPPVASSADRLAACAAMNKSSEDQRLARDIEKFVMERTLDRQVVKEQARLRPEPPRDIERAPLRYRGRRGKGSTRSPLRAACMRFISTKFSRRGWSRL